MGGFSYVIARDYGFAPNPFSGVCTLATCKPGIRKHAAIGDWVLGTGSVTRNAGNKLVFAMRISERLTFNEYWNDPRFLTKRPVMNGSLKKMFGDNIYHEEGGEWIQVDSHHSYEDGAPNSHNVQRDTSVNQVLVSEHFYYFGKAAIELPGKLASRIVKRGPGYRRSSSEDIQVLIDTVLATHSLGYLDDPAQFTHFERYKGDRR